MTNIKEHKISMNDRTRKKLLYALEMAWSEGALDKWQFDFFVNKLELENNDHSNTNN